MLQTPLSFIKPGKVTCGHLDGLQWVAHVTRQHTQQQVTTPVSLRTEENHRFGQSLVDRFAKPDHVAGPVSCGSQLSRRNLMTAVLRARYSARGCLMSKPLRAEALRASGLPFPVRR